MAYRLSRAALAAFALSFVSITANAATIAFKAELRASTEVPPNDSAASGTLTATLNTETNEFEYHIEFSGLSGSPISAHFHGPAAEGANAKPQIPIKASPIANPIDGTATLTADQEKDLEDGKWYFNVHTSAHPGGEIRGQILRAQ